MVICLSSVNNLILKCLYAFQLLEQVAFVHCGQANGFLGARGPAGGIPAGYTLVASEFLKQVQSAEQENRIQMAEFQKQGWTYHAKGLWYTLPGHHLPTLTFIGSPNFGKYNQHT
jgi:hypothetical protein